MSTIPANNFDSKRGNIHAEICSEGGKNLASIHRGDYVVYKGYDFDSGVAGFKARIAGPHDGSLEVRLDSPIGPMMGICHFEATGGWQNWGDAVCKVDNSQSGVRDVYLVFQGESANALVNVSSFVFLKSIVLGGGSMSVEASGRVDMVDQEPQAQNAWGMPESGFTDDFTDGHMSCWTSEGIKLVPDGDGYSAASVGTGTNFAFTPNVYINKTDTGGEWRTLAEASLAADVVIGDASARPGIGFISKDAKQSIYVVLNSAGNCIEAWRKLADGSLTEIARHPKAANASKTEWQLQRGVKYRLQIDWSPYSDGLIVFLNDDRGTLLTSFRTVIDLPAARRPLLICSGGNARFGHIKFDPTLDGWNFKWEWKKTPVLSPDVCNPAFWKGKDGKYYMMWRKFGADNYHGIISSTDGITWKRVKDDVLKCTGDMNVVVDPFGDGLVYITPGSGNLPWWTSDGSNEYTTWKNTGLTVGNIFGNSRIQEIIDTKKYHQMTPVTFDGADYRFIAFTEDWNRTPKPHTVVLLSNTLTNWVLANPDPVIPPQSNFWGEKGSAIGSAFVLPDGNILLADCACTFAGYTGAPEPSNVSAIVDGKHPWKVLKLGVLPDVPVSRENVWYQGPNFGTAYYYEPENDTLYFYGGFHDYRIGMMRVQNFSRSKLFNTDYAAKHDKADMVGLFTK